MADIDKSSETAVPWAPSQRYSCIMRCLKASLCQSGNLTSLKQRIDVSDMTEELSSDAVAETNRGISVSSVDRCIPQRQSSVSQQSASDGSWS